MEAKKISSRVPNEKKRRRITTTSNSEMMTFKLSHSNIFTFLCAPKRAFFIALTKVSKVRRTIKAAEKKKS